MDKQTLVEFESFIKNYKVIKFDKIWEKSDSNYKLIYNIEGLTIDTKFYANVKLIFWLDSAKEQFVENVITYLYTLYCDYKTITITTVAETFENILQLLDQEQTNKDMSDFILAGTEAFNAELKEKNVNNFIQNLKFIPQGNMPCATMDFKFELQSNDDTYAFTLKAYINKWELSYDSNKELVSLSDVPKKLIEWIYEIK